MTPNILQWLREHVAPRIDSTTILLEIGSLNVNGSPRSVLPTSNWTGLDRVPGRGVDIVTSAATFLTQHSNRYGCIVACECYEHDPRWWLTDQLAKSHLSPDGLYVVTAPAIGFPFHDFGGDYYRFTEMAFKHVIFDRMEVLDLRTIPGDHPGENTVVGVAINRVK